MKDVTYASTWVSRCVREKMDHMNDNFKMMKENFLWDILMLKDAVGKVLNRLLVKLEKLCLGG